MQLCLHSHFISFESLVLHHIQEGCDICKPADITSAPVVCLTLETLRDSLSLSFTEVFWKIFCICAKATQAVAFVITLVVLWLCCYGNEKPGDWQHSHMVIEAWLRRSGFSISCSAFICSGKAHFLCLHQYAAQQHSIVPNWCNDRWPLHMTCVVNKHVVKGSF